MIAEADNGALVILSGGLDSTVCMQIAWQHITGKGANQKANLENNQASTTSLPSHIDRLLAVSFDYGQRASNELDCAKRVTQYYRCEHLIVELDASKWGGSSLTDTSIDVPMEGDRGAGNNMEGDPVTRLYTGSDPSDFTTIPNTYVPARNIIFLSIALGIAEAKNLNNIYIGVNALDYSGYPDCRPEFIQAFQEVANIGLKRCIEGNPITIQTPLISLTKAEIIRLGSQIGAPLDLSWSCYLNGSEPCLKCESCTIRMRGFSEAGLIDPALT